MKYFFGQKGIWHKPASENTKAKDIPAVILEETKEGVIYIFTFEPILKGANNLTYRTATIFPSDFTLDQPKKIQRRSIGKDIPIGTVMEGAKIHCPVHSVTVCVAIERGIMCSKCYNKKANGKNT